MEAATPSLGGSPSLSCTFGVVGWMRHPGGSRSARCEVTMDTPKPARMGSRECLAALSKNALRMYIRMFILNR